MTTNKGKKGSREEGQHTCGTGTMEPSACWDVRGPGSELSARQRGAGEEEGVEKVAARGFELTSRYSSSRDSVTIAHVGREGGGDREQEEREEEAEEQVVVREEEEEDNEE